MLGQLCDRDCKFQNYHYLSENDTISNIISAFESIKFKVTASVEGVAS